MPSSALPVTPTQLMRTRSGRYEIHSPRYRLAGIPIGCTEQGVLAALGKPDKEVDKDKETHSWIYERDGHLNVTFLEDRVIAVGGSGRWSLEEAGQQGFTPFMMTQRTVLMNFGAPMRVDKSAQVFDAKPGELTLHFSKNDTVEQFWLTGEVKPISVQ